MTTASALQSQQRLIAAHPACPLSLKHEGAWQLRSYKVEAVLQSSHCAEQRKVKCSRCGASVVMLAYDMVSQFKVLSARAAQSRPCLTFFCNSDQYPA